MFEKLPIVVHCTEFKDPENLKDELEKHLFNGLPWQERIRLAKEIYADASRFLACTNGGAHGECAFCRKIIEAQRKVAQKILRNIRPEE